VSIMHNVSPVVIERIELWNIDQLQLWEGNPREHSEEQIDQIAASFNECGVNGPVAAINPQGKIIVGEARYRAAVKLGLKQVPVVVLRHLNEAEQRRYRIADNQLAQNSSWNEERLRAELATLVEEALSLDLIGFAEQELARLLASPELQKGKTDEDDVPDSAPTIISQVGDVWLMDGHRTLCADATIRSSFDRLMETKEAAMCFVDFPYNVQYTQTLKGKAPRRILNDDLGDSFEEFLESALRNILGFTQGAVYACMSSSELDTLQKAFRAAGGHWSTFLVWVKDLFTIGRSDYQHSYEVILYGWREGAQRYWCGARNQRDTWHFPKPRANPLHPTTKPVALVEQAIVNSSRQGTVVLDPFAGSGSTLIACQKTGRQARLMELDPQYVDVIVRRWQDFTGREAVLEGDGRTFAQISEARLERPEAAAEVAQ
jgi:DNA modification methylase